MSLSYYSRQFLSFYRVCLQLCPSSLLLNKIWFVQEAFISKSWHHGTCMYAPDKCPTWWGAQIDHFVPVKVQMTIPILHIRLLFLNQGLGVPSGHFCRQIESLLFCHHPWGVVSSLILGTLKPFGFSHLQAVPQRKLVRLVLVTHC